MKIVYYDECGTIPKDFRPHFSKEQQKYISQKGTIMARPKKTKPDEICGNGYIAGQESDDVVRGVRANEIVVSPNICPICLTETARDYKLIQHELGFFYCGHCGRVFGKLSGW
jgi:hypothetical protein